MIKRYQFKTECISSCISCGKHDAMMLDGCIVYHLSEHYLYNWITAHLLETLNLKTTCYEMNPSRASFEHTLQFLEKSFCQSEPNWYIYHSDHLGSSAFLTDASGDPTQHLQYMPFGETFVEQRSVTSYYTPYTFSAKESDTETGYSYFGARYYDADISIWLSVDPMAHKYPSMSAYMYCEGKALILTDPSGTTGIKARVLEGYFRQNDEPIPITREVLNITMQKSFQLQIVDQINTPGFTIEKKITRTSMGMQNFASNVLGVVINEDPGLVPQERKPVLGLTVQVMCSFEDPKNPGEPDWDNRKLFSTENKIHIPSNASDTPSALNPGMDGKTVPYINLENGSKLFYVILVVVIPETTSVQNKF